MATVRHLLHIVKGYDPLAFALIRAQAQMKGLSIVVVLIQQAANEKLPDLGVPIFALKGDVSEAARYPTLTDSEWLDHILHADQVVTW